MQRLPRPRVPCPLRIQRRLQARRRDRGEEEAVGLNSRVASAAVRAASRLRATIGMGTVTHVAPPSCPRRGARASETQRVVRGRRQCPPCTSCRMAGARGRATGVPESRSTSWSTDEPMVGAPGSATSPRPWRAPRWCSMVAVCLRPTNLTAAVGDLRLSPPLSIRLASYASAPAMPSTRHTSLQWPAGRPDRPLRSLLPLPVPRLHWMRSHAQWTRCAASSSASALLRVLSSVGDSATAPPSSTSASS